MSAYFTYFAYVKRAWNRAQGLEGLVWRIPTTEPTKTTVYITALQRTPYKQAKEEKPSYSSIGWYIHEPT